MRPDARVDALIEAFQRVAPDPGRLVVAVVSMSEPAAPLSRLVAGRSRNYILRSTGRGAIPLPDAEVDVVVADLPSPVDLAAACDEVARVLKPGGHLILAAPGEPQELRDGLSAGGVAEPDLRPAGEHPSAGWLAAGRREAHEFAPSSGCIVCGAGNPIGLHVRFWGSGRRAWTKVKPGAGYQGWQGVLHGGIVTALLDDAMWYGIHQATGSVTLTAELTVRYRKPVSDDDLLTVGGELVRQRGRIYESAAQLFAGDGGVLAEATAKFMAAPPGIREQL